MFLGGAGTGFSPDSQRVLCAPKMFKPLFPDHQITNTYFTSTWTSLSVSALCCSFNRHVCSRHGTYSDECTLPFRSIELQRSKVSQPRAHASEASLLLILEPKSLTAKLMALCPSRGALQGLWLARVPSGGQNQQDLSMRKVLRSHREPSLEL